ncbi:MAG TPA: hypothetical protein VGB71_17680, partial [Flavisolibacter sp.]
KNNPHFSNGNYNSIKKFAFKNDNEIWLGSNKSLVLLNVCTNKFRYIAADYRSDVFDMRYDPDSSKVFWTIEKGKLLQWDEEKGILTESIPVAETYPSELFRLPDSKEIWMPSANGLVRIDRERRSFFLTQHIPQLSGSLQPGSVAATLQDNEGIYWVGTANGISIYDTKHSSTLFLPLLPVSDKESENSMGSVFYDQVKDRYFVCATQASTVFIIEKKTGSIKKIKTDSKGSQFFHCNTIKADNDNNIWLLTDNHVYRYNEIEGTFKLFQTPNNGAIVVFRDMIQDAKGDFWFGAFNGGLYYYSGKEKKFLPPPGEGFDNILTVTSLHADKTRKTVWIGTFSIGLYCYELGQQKLVSFFETPQHPEYSALDLVQDITQDASGAVWAATHSGGVFRFTGDFQTGFQVSQFNMRSGLDENNFVALAANADSILWAMSGTGVLTLNKNGRAIGHLNNEQTFHFSSYLSDSRSPHKMVYNQPNGELAIAVGGGLLIHATRQVYSPFRVPVVLTNIHLNARPLSTEAMKKNEPQAFSYRENNLQFELAKLYFGSAKVILQYRLTGWNNDWQIASQ